MLLAIALPLDEVSIGSIPHSRLGIDPGAPPQTLPWPAVVALHRMLARSPASLMVLQIEDALGAIEQANLPGTIDQHPNWRRRLERSIAELARARRLQEFAAAIASDRPQNRQFVPKPKKRIA
jgi:4-alpha-glucanotransferase